MKACCVGLARALGAMGAGMGHLLTSTVCRFPVWDFLLLLVLMIPAGVQGQDAYEPDNSMAAARVLASGANQNRSIHAAGDVDWVRFTIGIGGAHSFFVQATGDMQAWLIRGRDGTIVGYDASAYWGDFPRIEQATLAPGAYFVKVQDWGNDEVIGHYQLSAYWVEVTTGPDPYEPDNTRASAGFLQRGSQFAQLRTIHFRDRDWMKFVVGPAGAWDLRLDTFGYAGSEGDTQMWLYRSNGVRVAYNDDGGPGRFSRIERSYLAPGLYYVKVQEKGNDGIVANYNIALTYKSRDIHEPNNTRANAVSLEPNSPRQRSNLCPAGDVDWFRFRLNSGGGNVRMETAGPRGDTVLALYNSSGVRIGYDDDSGTGRFSRIEAAVLSPGTYYLKVQAKGRTTVLPYYTIRVTMDP